MDDYMDSLIRSSLKKAAEETDISPEKKTEMLLNVLTQFLSNQLEDKDNQDKNQVKQ